MKPMQAVVCFTPGAGRLRRYLVDWLGNLKFMAEAQVIPPQQDEFAETVELFRLGVDLFRLDAPVTVDMGPRAA